MISPAQRRKIFVLARQLGWSLDTIHRYLKIRVGAEHVSRTTKYEAHRFINDLLSVVDLNGGAAATFPISRAAGRLTAITARQQSVITGLMEDAGWTQGKLNDYLEQFCARQLGDLTLPLAGNLIRKLTVEVRLRQ